MLDRMLAQVTAVVAVLIAQDPGAQALDGERGPTSALRLLAQMLVGGAQSMANWWARPPRGAPRAARGDRDGLRLAGARAAEPRRALDGALSELRRATWSTPPTPSRLALVAIARDGERREIAFGEVADRSARLAGALAARGVGARRRGDDRWSATGPSGSTRWSPAGGSARWRSRAPSSCGPRDLRARMEAVEPRAVVADERDLDLVAASGLRRAGAGRPGRAPVRRPSRRRRPSFAARGPGADRVHLGHGGRAEADPPRARLPARPERAGRALVRGAAGRPVLVHRRQRLVAVGPQRLRGRRGSAAPPRCSTTRRFDPDERLELLERERVNVLCMSPTEYRAIAKRARAAAAAGAAPRRAPPASRSTPRWCAPGRRPSGVAVHDGYGQTETGHLTGMPIGPPVRPGSMGRPLPGFRAWIDDGRAGGGPGHRADLLPRRRRATGPGAPATACARTRTATSGSRAAPTT